MLRVPPNIFLFGHWDDFVNREVRVISSKMKNWYKLMDHVTGWKFKILVLLSFVSEWIEIWKTIVMQWNVTVGCSVWPVPSRFYTSLRSFWPLCRVCTQLWFPAASVASEHGRKLREQVAARHTHALPYRNIGREHDRRGPLAAAGVQRCAVVVSCASWRATLASVSF
jgi:hypothetical protein